MRSSRSCLVVFFLNSVSLSLSCHLVIFKVLIVGSNLVDQLAARNDLHDAVGSCLYDLVVTGREEQNAREFDQTVVQCSDGLHIQMVSRLI